MKLLRTPTGSLLILAMLAACPSQEPDDSETRAARAAARAEGSESAAPAEEAAAQPAPQAAPQPAAPSAEASPVLRNPALATEQAPETYSVKLATTKGDIIIDVTRSWAPHGADRFYNLVKAGFYEDVAFFRVIDGFMAQVGLSGDPSLNRIWSRAFIPDDPPTQSNTRGMVSFATSGANQRVNQFFINFGDNSRLDPMGFAPFGRVRDMNVVDALHSGYGEGAPSGRGPAQFMIQSQGNAYLQRDFPQLDYIRSAEILPAG